MGIPVHPLLVHAAVVFVPLLATLAVAYALLPFIRPHTRWVLGLLALAGPAAALLAKLSGDRFFNRLVDRDLVTTGFVPRLEEHQNLGTMTLWVTIALGVLTLALVYLVDRGAGVLALRGGTGSRQIVSTVVSVLVVIAAAIALYYVIRTGDTGSKAVWEGS